KEFNKELYLLAFFLHLTYHGILNLTDIYTNLSNNNSVFPEDLKNLKDDIENSFEEVNNSVRENTLNLEIKNLISLFFKLKFTESLSENIVYKDKDFDINNLINDSNQ
ncbi:22793_t:CDS:2, partial [Cetraspora pellucida]